MHKLTMGSLFTGIGGLDLGMERAGFEIKWMVEIDDFCNKVLEKHWPEVKRYRDVREVGKHNLESVDLIAGGFPCQPHSVAGKRRGKDDDRNLWPEYLRIIREVRPTWVVGENVPGIITTMLDEILFDLENINYTCQTFTIPACAFNAPHRRNRVWIIAYSNSVGFVHGKSKIIPAKKRKFAQHNTSTNCGITSNPNGAEMEGAEKARNIKEIWSVNDQYIGGYAGWNKNWIEVATRLCGMDDGVPNRVDRLKSLGNAVVPQVAEYIGRCIMEAN